MYRMARWEISAHFLIRDSSETRSESLGLASASFDLTVLLWYWH